MTSQQNAMTEINPDHQWLTDILRYWPLLAAFVAIIGFLFSLKTGQLQGVERYHILRASQDTMRANIDALREEGRFRDLVLCKLYGKFAPTEPLPKKCDDVFQGWGSR